MRSIPTTSATAGRGVALARIEARTLVVGITTDIIFTPGECASRTA